MITSKPCCDNCPHYGETTAGHACLFNEPLIGEVAKLANANARCSNHPWIAKWMGDFWSDNRISLTDDWRRYLDELPFILDVLAGGGDKAVRGEKPADGK